MIRILIITLLLQATAFKCYTQEPSLWSREDRKKELYSIAAYTKIDFKKLNNSYDSSILIFYRNAIYQLLKRSDSLYLVQTTAIQKKVKNNFKWLSKSDTLFKDKVDKFIYPVGSFSFLFSIDEDYAFVKNEWTASPGIDTKTLFILSLREDEIKLRECLPTLVDNVYFIDKNLLSILERFITEYKYWDRFQKFIQASGYGTYRYGTHEWERTFQYKKNGLYSFYIEKKLVEIPVIPKIFR